MSNFTFVLFWEFQISIQTMVMSDFKKALMTWGQDTRTVSSKIWEVLITLSIISEVIERLMRRLVFSTKYGISKIFKYNFNWGSLGLIKLLVLILFSFFIYFSTTFKSKGIATLLVVIIILLLSRQIKS